MKFLIALFFLASVPWPTSMPHPYGIYFDDPEDVPNVSIGGQYIRYHCRYILDEETV